MARVGDHSKTRARIATSTCFNLEWGTAGVVPSQTATVLSLPAKPVTKSCEALEPSRALRFLTISFPPPLRLRPHRPFCQAVPSKTSRARQLGSIRVSPISDTGSVREKSVAVVPSPRALKAQPLQKSSDISSL